MIAGVLGTMHLDFRRLVTALDAIAAETGEETILQLGLAHTKPAHCPYFTTKPHDELLALQREARVIVCHAGIGAVMDALATRRPFVVVPRLRRYGEHNNDHQVDLAEAVAKRGWARVVYEMDDLAAAVAWPSPPPAEYAPQKAALLADLRATFDRLTGNDR